MATFTDRPLAEVLTAIESRLAALNWQAGPPAVKAFDEVRRWASDDLVSAFKALLAVRQRVCIVVLTGVTYDDSRSHGGLLAVSRTARISLLISDAVLADPAKAIWGSPSNPGSWRLAELAVTAVSGQLAAPPGGVRVRPSELTPLAIEDLSRQLPGRAVVTVDLDAVGGLGLENFSAPGPLPQP
jgi:hypothetical protein